MDKITELNVLIDQYMTLHPNGKNPMQYLFNIDIQTIIEMLKNANGKEIIYVYDDNSDDDGGLIMYAKD